jgi:hypothetical protein
MAADASSARTERGNVKRSSPTRPTAPMPSPTEWYDYDCGLRKASGLGIASSTTRVVNER